MIDSRLHTIFLYYHASVYLRMPTSSLANDFHFQSLVGVTERFQRHFPPTDRHVCVFVERQLNRWRRCSCWSCPLCIHTGHELDCSSHWPVHVCPADSVDRVRWSPVDWCWPSVQSVPLTTTDVTVNHIAHVVGHCRCSLTKTGCVGAVQPSRSPRTNDLPLPLSRNSVDSNALSEVRR